MTSSQPPSLADPIIARYGSVLSKTIQRFWPRATVYWFGSRVTGRARDNSDLDIAIDAGTPLDFATLSNLREALAETDCPVLVDVVDLGSVDAPFRQRILEQGFKASP